MFNAMRHLIEVGALETSFIGQNIRDMRIPEEEDVTQATTQHAEVGQVMREHEPELFQDRGMDME